MERAFAVGERQFKLNKIDAFKQFHIVRRMAPLLSDLLPAMGKIKSATSGEGQSEEDKFQKIADLAAPLMSGFSKLSDEDSNKVLYGLLSSVEMQQSAGNWVRIVSADNQLMFADLELPLLLQAAGKAFMYNMAGFFALLPQVSPGGK